MVNNISWNEYFIKVAEVISIKSKDPVTKVGAIIVNKDNRIVSTGYNGFPKGMKEHPNRWEKPNKYQYVIHAEINAILYANMDLTGCKLYCTLEPCNECAKVICASGIKEVYYKETRENISSRELFVFNNVRLEKI